MSKNLCSCGCKTRVRRHNKKNRPAFAPSHSWERHVRGNGKPHKNPRVIVEELKMTATAALEGETK